MPAIRQLVKGTTLHNNEPSWLERALYEEEVVLGIEYCDFDYVAFAENGDIYGIDGTGDNYWTAILHKRNSTDAVQSDNYKSALAVKEVKPGGLSIGYKTRKELLSAIESDSLQFLKEREPQGYANEVSHKKARPSSRPVTQRKEIKVENKTYSPRTKPNRLKTQKARGTKRIGAALLLALIGIFTPGTSLLIVPLLISGSESVLKQQSSLGHETTESSIAWFLLGAGIICGLIGIFSPVLSFISAILICQSYNIRCKDMYQRMNK